MDKKLLYEHIMTSVAKEVKRALNESAASKTEDMSDVEWLNRYLIYDPWGGRTYIQSVYDPVQNYAVYGLTKDNWERQKESLSQNKAINRFRKISNSYGYVTLCFKYDKDKDVERQNQIKAEKDKYEADVANADTTAYAPTKRDWDKMIGYMNGHSNPERVAKSCKDPNKVVARYIIAKTLGWKEAAREFKYRINELKILSDIELEAYQRKYATYNIPEEYKDLLQDYSEYDLTGGIASNSIEHNEILPDNVKKYIYNNASIQSYSIELLDPIPLKKMGRSRYSTSYTIGNINLAKVTFKMVDGSEKDTWFVYGRGYAHFSKLLPKQAWKDEIGSGAHAVHNLKYIFGDY